MNAQEKREEQKKETWIKNIMRIQEKSREEAEILYKKIFNQLREREEVEKIIKSNEQYKHIFY